MKLFEMTEKPTKAGQARILFSNDVSQPVRQDREIYLPDNPELEFYDLVKSRQFLVRLPARTAHDRDEHVWFGGTDEKPFLVRLQGEAFLKFIHHGEEGFFAGLVPESARELVNERGLTLRRQGDIFAVDLATSWEEIIKAYRIIGGVSLEPKQETGPLFGTRHEIESIGVPSLKIFGQSLGFVSSGRLQAPDHRPLELETPHALFQARYLWSPKDAD